MYLLRKFCFYLSDLLPLSLFLILLYNDWSNPDTWDEGFSSVGRVYRKKISTKKEKEKGNVVLLVYLPASAGAASATTSPFTAAL